jgi:hypothetical protein
VKWSVSNQHSQHVFVNSQVDLMTPLIFS